MKKTPAHEALSQFLKNDFHQEELLQLPHDLQELFDMILDTEYGNCIHTRRKMLQIKELTSNLSKTLKS